jgi:hypothetical protein
MSRNKKISCVLRRLHICISAFGPPQKWQSRSARLEFIGQENDTRIALKNTYFFLNKISVDNYKYSFRVIEI